ncbi:MAG: hypothetical protein NVS3B21_01050 [Acidimicrobiales bacterium]
MSGTTGCLHSPIGAHSLFDPDPLVRLQSARAAGRWAMRSVLRQSAGWPPFSPGAANAWLLLVTAKPPMWRDPMMIWPDEGPTLGRPHPGFFYPDPLGFWTEVRRWVTVLMRINSPDISSSDALSLTAVLHTADDPGRVHWATKLCAPGLTLFLDEASRETAAVEAGPILSIPDPHREGTTYDGWWTTSEDGQVLGKAPQHPASHRFYRAADMDTFLRAAPFTRMASDAPD